jgi:cytidylate kinase
MEEKSSSIESFVQEQLERWKAEHEKKKAEEVLAYSVITLSMEPGSGGCFVAQKVAEQLGFGFFHRDIVQGIAKSAHSSERLINTLERERLSGVEDFLSSVIREKYLYPGTYQRHLMKVISAIAKHGKAVIVGRGANFILPAEKRLSVRVISPLEDRIRNVCRQFKVKEDKARRRVLQRESARRAFVRQTFHVDISDPAHYDMVLNTGKMDIDSAVAAIVGAARHA